MGCVKCGVSGGGIKLFDVISDEGIVKVCRICLAGENVPVVSQPSLEKASEAVKPAGVYDRLSNMSGIKPDFSHAKNSISDEVTLREIVDRNFQDRITTKKLPRSDLIENFHWVIMRARRSKKLTPEQLAKQIGEPALAIKVAEQGNLPDDGYLLVGKLESALGINILKKEVAERIRFQKSDKLTFEDENTKMLTLDDLRELKKKREAELIQRKENEAISESEEIKVEEDLDGLQIETFSESELPSREEDFEFVENIEKEFDGIGSEYESKPVENRDKKDLSFKDISDFIFRRNKE